jgi:WD40 repeat protein
VLASVAFGARSDALRQRDTAVSRAVANASRGLRETNPELSRNLAVAAYRIAPTSEAASAVIDGIDVPSRVNLPARTTGNGVFFGPSSGVVALELNNDDDNLTRTAVLDLASGREAVNLPDPGGSNVRRAFSADGALLATTDDSGTVKLWNPRDAAPQPLGRVETGMGVGQAGIEFSPTGRQLAVYHGNRSIGFYDITDPRAPSLAASLVSPGPATLMRYNDDGTSLALALRGGRIALVDVGGPDPSPRMVLDGHPNLDHPGTVFELAFSPDGALLVSSGDDDRVRVWAARAGGGGPLLAETTGNARLFFAHTGRTLFAGRVSGVSVHDLSDPTGLSNGAPIPGAVVAVDVRNRRLATATTVDRRTIIHVWDIEKPAAPRKLRDLLAIGGTYLEGAFSRDGKTLYTADEHSVDIWDLTRDRNPQSLAVLEENTDIITMVQSAADGDLMLTGSWDGTAKLYDTTTPDRPRRLGEFEIERGESIAAISPDGRLVAANDRPGNLALWDISAGGYPRPVGEVHIADPTVVEFAPDSSSVAIGNWSGMVEVWNVRTSGVSLASRFRVGTHRVDKIVFLGQTGSVAVGGFDGLALWDLSIAAAPRQIGRFVEDVIVADVAFDAKRNLLATVDHDGGLLLWAFGADRLEKLARVETERLFADRVTFDVEAARLVVGSREGRIMLISVEEPRSPDYLGSFLGHGSRVGDVAVGADGLVISASNDRAVITWNFDVNDMADYVCTTSQSPLSPEDWGQYIPDAPFRETCNH